MPWVPWIFFCLLSVASLSAADTKLKLLTTFLPAHSLASSIAGEHAEIRNLLQESVNLHDYQLTPRDLRQLASADLIIINGLGMETFLERALPNLGPNAESKLVALSRGLAGQLIPARHDHAGRGHDHAHDFNPHIWLDPILAAHAATNILTALQKADPAHSADYANNARALIQRLHDLDREIAAKTAPLKSVPFITYHDAFPYFVRRYGLNLVAVVEQVPEVAPSPREMRRLLQTIREKKARVLFTEPGGPSRLARQITADADIELAELDPLEIGEFKPGAYEDGMRRNLETLVSTLK